MQAHPAEANQARAVDAAPAHLPYLRGLDGIRAIAVIAVMLYHADLNVSGGYLGVESFFVLSGFLITALLLLDWQHYGRVRLKVFWARRARRLLPALCVMLAGTLALTAILLPAEFATLKRDTIAAVAYATNWYLIASQQSYFTAADRPPLLQHLWSLAIEEQFYIVWPLVFAAGMRLLRTRGFLVLTVVAAVASAGLMAALYDPGADPSRIYYGTDTRASAILLGAALALLWAPGRTPASARRRVGVALDLFGILALGGLIAAYVILNEQHPLLYRGGFSLVAISTAVMIAAATHPAARVLPWLLERRPLPWIGVRSYGLYLWHWPVFMVMRPGDLPVEDWQLQTLRFALTFVLAALSYTWVELPIRRGALEHVWRVLRRAKETNTPAAEESALGTQTTDQGAPAHMPGLLARLASPSQAWYRRWAPVLATGVLTIGVLYVATSVSQAAIRDTLANAGTPTALATPATPVAAAVPTDAAVVATDVPSPASSTPTAPAAATPAAVAQATIDPALASELQHILDHLVADGSIPGAVLTVRLANGTTWTGASGLADRDADVAMTPDTRVRIGSLSKMFTGVVVLQLAEEGKIDLDKPIATWLPDVVPKADAITVRHLLQHTSGLYDYLEDRRFAKRAYDEPERIWKPQELVAYATRFPPAFAPGAKDRWDYSSTNYVILGMLVEQVTGNTLAQELRQRIFEPLGLRETYAVPEDQVGGPQARGYSKSDDQTDVALSFTFGTANIVTTVDDLRRFGSALFSGELLKPATREQMEQFVNGKGKYDMPELEYGLGLMRNRLPVGPGPDDRPRPAELSRVVGHIGGFAGFRAALWYAPESGTLVALSVNQASTDPNDLATQVFGAILRQQGY